MATIVHASDCPELPHRPRLWTSGPCTVQGHHAVHPGCPLVWSFHTDLTVQAGWGLSSPQWQFQFHVEPRHLQLLHVAKLLIFPDHSTRVTHFLSTSEPEDGMGGSLRPAQSTGHFYTQWSEMFPWGHLCPSYLETIVTARHGGTSQ